MSIENPQDQNLTLHPLVELLLFPYVKYPFLEPSRLITNALIFVLYLLRTRVS